MFLNVLKSAASFLQQGVSPPNTPTEQKEVMENTNHFSSKKFFLAISGFIILGMFYITSVAVLLFLIKDSTIVSAYTVLFTKTMEVFATIMAVYLGGQALVDLRYNSSSSASLQGTTQQNNTTIKEEITVIHTNSKEDDYELK